jgi:cation diffusion facilitator family transporter
VATAKIAYGYWADALSVRADGFHSLTDSTNNLVGLVGISLASRPADKDHPYGHQKLELLAAGLVGLSLLVMAYDVATSALSRLFSDGPVPQIGVGAFVVLLGTLAVNVGVARYERRRAEQLQSPFLLSDSAHTRSDVLVTLCVLLAVVFVKLGYPSLDLIAAIAVAGFIGWTGVAVLRSNLGYLADTALLDREHVERIVLKLPGIASTHKIRTRGTPAAIYVDLHIQIAPHLNVVEAHQVTHWVIDAIKAEYPAVADVMVHTEPADPAQSCNPIPDGTAPEGAALHEKEGA